MSGEGGGGERRRRALHILAVPFQQEGHVNAMLRLAQCLAAQENVVVTFAYPARFFHLAHKLGKPTALIPTAASASTSDADSASQLRIHVVEDGLPRQEEQSLTPLIVLASIPTFQHSVKLLLDDLFLKAGQAPVPLSAADQPSLPPLTCIISDTFMPWTQDLANAAHIPRVDFWTCPAAVYAMGSQLSLLVSNGTLPLPKGCWVDVKSKWSARAPLIDCVPGLPPFPPTDLPAEFVLPEEVTDVDLQFMLAAFSRVREAHTILIHSVYYLESPVFDALRAIGLPVQSIGPLSELPPPPSLVHIPPNRHPCLAWLDSQPPSSVIYVALGTIAKLSPAELHALALALEASGHPFLWVIRPDSLSSPLSDALPSGFLQRTVDRPGSSGFIVPWAPQTQVLQHSSTAAFFSHCGWNSTLESMWEGIPMVACPRGAEQRSNARWIVEQWKIGVELKRLDDGSFTQEAVERAVQEVLQVKEKVKNGPDYRERALHAKEVARRALGSGGTSWANLQRFLQDLRSIRANIKLDINTR